jgi:hypothetical protein
VCCCDDPRPFVILHPGFDINGSTYLSTIQQIVTLKVGEILRRYRKGGCFQQSQNAIALSCPPDIVERKCVFNTLYKVLMTWQNDKRATGARTLLTY